MSKRYFITVRQGFLDLANKVMIFSDTLENVQVEAEKLFKQVTDSKFNYHFTMFIEDNKKVVSRYIASVLDDEIVSGWEQTK